MSIEKRVRPYEIFIRLNESGFAAAHYGEVIQFIENGAIISEQEQPVRPITKAECAQHIGEISAQLIEAADTARAEAQALVTENEQLRAALSSVAPDAPPES